MYEQNYQPSQELALEEFKKNSLLNSFSANRFTLKLNISRGHLLNEVVSEQHFVSSVFQNTQILATTFSNCNFNEVVFSSSEFRSVKFMNCSFSNVKFLDNLILGVSFENCYFENCELDLKSEEVNTLNVFVKEVIVSTPPQVMKSAVSPMHKPVLKESTAQTAKTLTSVEPLGRFGHLDLEEK